MRAKNKDMNIDGIWVSDLNKRQLEVLIGRDSIKQEIRDFAFFVLCIKENGDNINKYIDPTSYD